MIDEHEWESAFPEFSVDSLPHLTTEQMIEVDRAMIEDHRIELIQMMENAGRNLARLSKVRYMDCAVDGSNVVVLAGRGGNGGGALVAARRLHCWGANVRVLVTRSAESFEGVLAHQLSIVERLGIVADDMSLPEGKVDVILDGLIGYSLSGNPSGRAAELIHWANEQSVPTIALDTPSGLDTTTGQVFVPAIMASSTLTLALPKAGLFSSAAQHQVGELYLGDISVPPEVYTAMGLAIPRSLFAGEDIVRIV
tara:strand:- start:9764 stop:10522 length:759 start_codon:yes stop_codon:yes gene_type:complete